MIVSLVQPKGGTAKSTLALCLATSRAFLRAFESTCLVELDAQGSLAGWYSQRQGAPEGLAFAQVLDTNPATVQERLRALSGAHGAFVLDAPGESVPGFASRLAGGTADVVLVPMRTSTFDEAPFTALWDILRSSRAVVAALPVFTNPRARRDRIRKYFEATLPEDVVCLEACFPARAAFENFSRDGATLQEYAAAVRGNARLHRQAKAAVADVERIAREVLKHGPTT